LQAILDRWTLAPPPAARPNAILDRVLAERDEARATLNLAREANDVLGVEYEAALDTLRTLRAEYAAELEAQVAAALGARSLRGVLLEAALESCRCTQN
jgi:hypothetical protein